MFGKLLGKGATKLIELLIGYYKLDDGKVFINSKSAVGAILLGLGFAGVAGAVLLNPELVQQIMPEMSGKTAETLFLLAGVTILGAVRYLIGMRNAVTKNTANVANTANKAVAKKTR